VVNHFSLRNKIVEVNFMDSISAKVYFLSKYFVEIYIVCQTVNLQYFNVTLIFFLFFSQLRNDGKRNILMEDLKNVGFIRTRPPVYVYTVIRKGFFATVRVNPEFS